MKRILTILAILSLIGTVAALPNYGPAQGFHNRGDISMGGDLTVGDDADVVGDLTAGTITSDGAVTATTTVSGEQITSTDDATIADDMTVGGDLTVTGILTTGGTISSGVISEDIQMAAGKDLDCAAGASEFDWSLGTGIFKTTSGINTIGGGTNGITLNGPVTGASGKNWSMVGASLFTVGSLGIQAINDTINLIDALAGTSATFSGDVTSSGTITAEQITTTDDMTVTDDLDVVGDLTVAGAFTPADVTLTDDLVVGDDADVVADLTAGTITSDATITATTTVTGADVVATDDLTVGDEATITGDLGGSNGIFSGIVQAEHVYSTDDMNLTDDLVVGDDCDVVGDLTAGTIVSDAGVSGTTGSFSEPISVTKAIGTAPFTITSTTKVANLNVDAVDDKSSTDFCLLDGTQALVADWDVGNYDLQMTDCRVDVNLDVTGASTLNTVVAEDINSTDDAIINDDLSVKGLVTVDETFRVTGLTTVSAVKYGVNTTTTAEEVTLTSSDLKTVYGINASGGNVTLTLPAADTVTGRLYMIAAAADMGDNNIVLATTGSGKLGGSQGADTLTSTDATAAIQLISDGTHYLVVAKVGTWT